MVNDDFNRASVVVCVFNVMFGLLNLSIGFAFRSGERWGRRIVTTICFLMLLEVVLSFVNKTSSATLSSPGLLLAIPYFVVFALSHFDPLKSWLIHEDDKK